MNAERKQNRFPARAAAAEWKTAAGWAFNAAKAHRLRLDAVIIEFQPEYQRGPMPDTAGIFPTEKAIVDAVVELGVLPDDNGWHNAGHLSRPPVKGPVTGVRVRLWPVAAVPHECTCRDVWERSQRANQLKAGRARGR